MKAYGKRYWTTEEKEAVLRNVGDILNQKRIPSKFEIVPWLEKEEILADRSWTKVKHFCRNYIKSSRRKSAKRTSMDDSEQTHASPTME